MWLDATTAKVREAEPVDLGVERSALEAKHGQLVELARDLARCEPRVVSLQEAADQLELQAESPACRQVDQSISDSRHFTLVSKVKTKLALLIRSLRGLRQAVSIYITNLARALGLPPPPELPPFPETFEGPLLPMLTDRVTYIASLPCRCQCSDGHILSTSPLPQSAL